MRHGNIGRARHTNACSNQAQSVAVRVTASCYTEHNDERARRHEDEPATRKCSSRCRSAASGRPPGCASEEVVACTTRAARDGYSRYEPGWSRAEDVSVGRAHQPTHRRLLMANAGRDTRAGRSSIGEERPALTLRQQPMEIQKEARLTMA